MSPPIELVVTDLDGTFWYGGVVHETTRSALDELARRSIPVLVATARKRKSAREALAAHGLALPAVLIDGGMVVDELSCPAFYSRPFEPDDLRVVIEVFDRFGEQPVFEVDLDSASPEGVDTLVGDRPSMPAGYLERQNTITRDFSSESFATDLEFPVFGAVSVIARSRVREMAAALDAAGVRTWVEFFPNAPETGILLVRPAATSKWSGVVAYCERHGIDPVATLAIADNDNDVELLNGAGIALAMASGTPAALAAADHVVAATTEGGWAQLLDHL